MKLKVKIKETDRAMMIHYIDMDNEHLTAGEILNNFAADGEISANEIDKLMLEERGFGEFRNQPLLSILGADMRCSLTSRHLNVTLTLKSPSGQTLAGQSLLDFSLFLETMHQYIKQTDRHYTENGTVFYIQLDTSQFLVRKEAAGLEFYDFKNQFNHALKDKEASRQPFLFIELKTKAELTRSEWTWLRNMTLPKKGRENPLIHLDGASLDAELLMEICTLIHRVIVIIGRFQKFDEGLMKNEIRFPSYVEYSGEVSVGYIHRSQLEEILKR